MQVFTWWDASLLSLGIDEDPVVTISHPIFSQMWMCLVTLLTLLMAASETTMFAFDLTLSLLMFFRANLLP